MGKLGGVIASREDFAGTGSHAGGVVLLLDRDRRPCAGVSRSDFEAPTAGADRRVGLRIDALRDRRRWAWVESASRRLPWGCALGSRVTAAEQRPRDHGTGCAERAAREIDPRERSQPRAPVAIGARGRRSHGGCEFVGGRGRQVAPGYVE
jgi:hypothetical protein